MHNSTPVGHRRLRWPVVAAMALVVAVLSPLLIVFEMILTAIVNTMWLIAPRLRGRIDEPFAALLIGCVPYLALVLVAAAL
jgi:hypothetical protein